MSSDPDPRVDHPAQEQADALEARSDGLEAQAAAPEGGPAPDAGPPVVGPVDLWPDAAGFARRAAGARVVPVVRRLPAAGRDPMDLYRVLAGDRPGSFLLESAEPGGTWSRYSIVGPGGRTALTCRGTRAVWTGPVPAGVPTDGEVTDVLAETLRVLHTPPTGGLGPLTSGLVGVLGWDVVRHWEHLPCDAPGEPDLPEVYMTLVEELAVLDHLAGEIALVAVAINWDGGPDGVQAAWERAAGRIEAMTAALDEGGTAGHPVGDGTDTGDETAAHPTGNGTDTGDETAAHLTGDETAAHPTGDETAAHLTGDGTAAHPTGDGTEARAAQEGVVARTAPTEYMAAVEAGKRAIVEGEVFQVVLSQRFDVPCTADALEVYRALRATNPSPYMYLMRCRDAVGRPFDVVGSSPEALVRVIDGRVVSHPIAGTRPRGADAEADDRARAELTADPKERAEHLMLVDLARNDLARVCEPGTVTVEEFMAVERYSHVMHMVSTVAGRRREGIEAVDVLRACFPAGTLSGAPKIRAMELIDALEPARRGVYGGAVGYLDLAGNLDMAIAIRTAVLTGGVAHVQAGAGVVADSTPAGELAECRAKAAAVLGAVRTAQGRAGRDPAGDASR